MQPSKSAMPVLVDIIEYVSAFVKAGKTGRILLQVKEGRVMQIETTEVKRV